MRWTPQYRVPRTPAPPSALLASQARPLKFWPFALIGVSSICVAKLSLHPRVKFLKDQTGWTLRYDYAKDYDPGPADKGIGIVPPPPQLEGSTASAAAEALSARNKEWILDTGANAHLCTNRDLLHAYTESPWGQTTIGFRGANSKVDHYIGIGDCTLEATVTATEPSKASTVQKVTLHRVYFYPAQGFNLLSWSALKRGAMKQGLRLKMVENEDWSLSVCSAESSGNLRQIMRFRPENGLYLLDQADKAAEATKEPATTTAEKGPENESPSQGKLLGMFGLGK